MPEENKIEGDFQSVCQAVEVLRYSKRGFLEDEIQASFSEIDTGGGSLRTMDGKNAEISKGVRHNPFSKPVPESYLSRLAILDRISRRKRAEAACRLEE